MTKFFYFGGEDGIRTHERIASLHAFQACALNHSATSPKIEPILFKYFQNFF